MQEKIFVQLASDGGQSAWWVTIYIDSSNCINLWKDKKEGTFFYYFFDQERKQKFDNMVYKYYYIDSFITCITQITQLGIKKITRESTVLIFKLNIYLM